MASPDRPDRSDDSGDPPPRPRDSAPAPGPAPGSAGGSARDLGRISSTPGNQSRQVRVARLAERQWGHIAWSQLLAFGVSKRTISRWVADGYLHRVHPAVYAVGHRPASTESRLAAALLYAGRGAALSARSAAWVWRLTGREPHTIEIVTANTRQSIPGVRVQQRRNRPHLYVNRLAVTTVPWTLLDLASCQPLDEVRYALAEADYRGLLVVDDIQAILRQGRPGSKRLRQALRRHQPQLARTRSDGERALIALVERHGLPIPIMNAKILGHTVDAVWPEHRLIVEIDGHDGHRTRAQRERDYARDLALRTAGYIVLRYTAAQLIEQPDRVADDLLIAIERAA